MTRISLRYFSIVCAALAVLPLHPASACDLCGIYSAVQQQQPDGGTFRFGVSEQYTDQDKVQYDGHYVDNVDNQYLRSSVTQFVGSYDLSSSVRLQANLPYIYRSYKRAEGEGIDKGHVDGIGDTTITTRYYPYRYSDGQKSFLVSLLAGLKIPTGDSHELGEEQSENHSMPEESPMSAALKSTSSRIVQRHADHEHEENVTPSAVHGHDLALGSGSWDFPVGTGLLGQWDRYLFSADVQYMIRTQGSYNYRYANDLIWSAGPGAYLILEDEDQLALRATMSGEYKRNDPGSDDTAINSLFIGPELIATLNNSFLGNFGIDLPIDVKNSGYQTVPNYRLRFAVTYKF